MEAVVEMMPSIVFFIIGSIAVAASILVVAMRNPVHSALFLLVAFLCVAVLFVLAGAEFVGAVQVLVYAGGIMVLFLFVVMLINVRHLADERILSPYWKGGLLVGLTLFILFAAVVRPGVFGERVDKPKGLRTAPIVTVRNVKKEDGRIVRQRLIRHRTMGNSEAIGMVLYTDYLVPFEVASLFLLVAMIGAIVIGKRQLDVEEEELMPAFILERAAEEKQVKEKTGA